MHSVQTFNVIDSTFVSGFIGRASDDIFQDIQNTLNDALNAFIDQDVVNSIIDQIDELVESGLIKGGGTGLDDDSVNGILGQINGVLINDIGDAILSGDIDIVDLDSKIINLVGPVLKAPNDGAFVISAPPRR